VENRVLFVDDDADFRYTVEKLLRQAGYEVVCANGYADALELLSTDSKISLLFTDIMMRKGINGFALARMARMRRPDLRLLYITGFDVPLDEADGKVIRKPIADDQLIEEVRLALAG
jgi:CheY-like chemotaxis protein